MGNVLPSSNIKKNLLYLILVQLANYIAPLVILPYLARVIGIDGVGIVAICLSICAIALIVTDFGFAISSTYWISINRGKKNKIATYIGAVLIIKIILSLSFIAILSLYPIDEMIKVQNILYPLIAAIVFQTFQIPWFFQGIERMQNITYCTVATKLSYLILVILYVKNENNIPLVITFFAISNFIYSLMGFILYYKQGYTISIPSIRKLYMVFKNNIPFFFSRAAVGIYTSASTLIVGSYAGSYQAALYSSSEKLYQGAVSLTSPISQVLYPHLAKTKDRKILIKMLYTLLPIGFILSGLCIYFSDNIIIIIYGKDFLEASRILKVFIFISILSFISINLGYPLYSTINRLDIVNKSVVIGGFLQLIFVLLLYITHNITAYNISLSILVTEIVILQLRLIPFYFIIRKNHK